MKTSIDRIYESTTPEGAGEKISRSYEIASDLDELHRSYEIGYLVEIYAMWTGEKGEAINLFAPVSDPELFKQLLSEYVQGQGTEALFSSDFYKKRSGKIGNYVVSTLCALDRKEEYDHAQVVLWCGVAMEKIFSAEENSAYDERVEMQHVPLIIGILIYLRGLEMDLYPEDAYTSGTWDLRNRLVKIIKNSVSQVLMTRKLILDADGNVAERVHRWSI